jgi:hypothetical protein
MSAAKDFDRMREKLGDGVKGLDRAFGTSRQINDDGPMADNSNAAGKYGGGRFLDPLAAYFFRETGYGAVGDIDGGFGRGVAGTKTGAASGEEKFDATGIGDGPQLAADFGGVIGAMKRGSDVPAKLAAALDESRPGKVLAFTAGDGIADGENGHAHREL